MSEQIVGSANGPKDIISDSSLILDLPPSSIEFCPSNAKYFIVGTYKLEDEELADDSDTKRQIRSGSLELFELMGRRP